MPKFKKLRTVQALRHDPLEKQIADSKITGKLKVSRKKQEIEEEYNDESVIPEKLSKTILEVSRELQSEDNVKFDPKLFQSRNVRVDDDEEELVDTYDEDLQEVEIDAEDEEILAKFMPAAKSTSRSLADIILEKISEKIDKSESANAAPSLDEKVVSVYTQVGQVLAKWTSGKIPKAFKIVPSLKNWEEILILTKPESWTPNAMFAATKLFASNLNPRMAQRFYYSVLFPSIRRDISKNKRLNFHYYMSLKKAIFKPAAFFKGILFPLVQDECTTREAVIIASVLAKVSIPVEHSAVALMKLVEMPYNGIASIFIKTLLNKKYSLPVSVLQALVNHFFGFLNETRVLPVLWHQTLLVFAQRYKTSLTAAQKEGLKQLLKVQNHHAITPEIKRELFGISKEKMDLDEVEMKLA